jgi:hypothetical protein
MKKKTTIAAKVDKSWTVLLVDGQGRIRRIRNFRRKLWMLFGASAVALILAAVMGVLYGTMLKERATLSDNLKTLEEKVATIRQQNELLKARAVRLETQAANVDSAATGENAAESPAPKVEAEKPQTSPKAPPSVAADTTTESVPVVQTARAEVEAVAKPEEKLDPQVDAEGLKIVYRPETETIEAQFVIKNTGQGSAAGRAVVVLYTDEGQSQLHFALPSVPLREGRPIGSNGRRFSISRFMTLNLQRRFAEPDTHFAGAVVYAYTLEGRPLLDKSFDVSLDIPARESLPETTTTPGASPAGPLPNASPLGLDLPEREPETPTGVQP